MRFIFYKVVVRLYQFYLFLNKRLGGKSGGTFSLFTNQRASHYVVGLSIVFFIIFNLTNKTQAVSSEEMAGKTFLSEIVSSEFSENEQLIEEYFDEEAEISPVQQTYLDNLSNVKPQAVAEMTPEEEADLYQEMNSQEGTALIKPDYASINRVNTKRTEIVEYTVQDGDTISTIAANFSISVNTVLWENDLNAYSLIRPGDKLLILPVTGVMHKVAKGESLAKIANDYGIDEAAILSANRLADASDLIAGARLVIPGGQKTSYATRKVAKSYSGLSIITDLIKPKSSKSIFGNKMAWPTVGYRLTQYYSWRHHAIDVGIKIGTPIYACDAGVVEVAGWGTGYGNQIVIDHGGGKKSRYAHLSKFYVKKGQKVSKGEAIAASGSTGWSTGPHLHFEVIINGVKYNPLNYVK